MDRSARAATNQVRMTFPCRVRPLTTTQSEKRPPAENPRADGGCSDHVAITQSYSAEPGAPSAERPVQTPLAQLPLFRNVPSG